MSGKRQIEPQDKRDKPVRSYITASEEVAVNLLASEHGYHGASDAVRKGLGLLIRMKHPELTKYLRSDLTAD